MITIHWRDGSQSTWSATFLSYADGMLWEYAHLHVDNMEELGVRVSRGFHSTDPTINTPYMIAEEKVIITPEELGSVLMVLNGGTIKLMYDPETKKLADVLLPQIEAIVFGKTKNKKATKKIDAEIGQTEELLDSIELGIDL